MYNLNSIMSLPLGALASNCYIIPSEKQTAVVVDPASSSEVVAVLDSRELTLGGVVITHGHFDHFAGVAALTREFDVPVFAPDLDSEMFQSESKSWAWFMQDTPFTPITPDYLFSDGQEFIVSGVRFRVMGTPGHTAGSCLLFCEDYGVIFTGDVLFQSGIGRTDGFSGSNAMQLDSLRKIRAISGDYKLLCGHGESSTLSDEKAYNPYLRNL